VTGARFLLRKLENFRIQIDRECRAHAGILLRVQPDDKPAPFGNFVQKYGQRTQRDRVTASRLLHAKNEAHQQPLLNLQIARTYLAASSHLGSRRSSSTIAVAKYFTPLTGGRPRA
jgi:hypothetical protein